MASPYKNQKSWKPATVRIAKKYARPVTPAQSSFAQGLVNVVNSFVNTKGPKRKTPYLRTKRSFER